jgi:hypothetical protein
MKATDELFLLIKSLSKTEKGYFKKFSSIHAKSKETGYQKLFDTINKQNEYNEELLKKSLKGEPFLQYLSTAKYNLYNFILKSQRFYHENMSEDVVLLDLLKDVEFLHSKGLYSPCEKLLNKAKGIASEYGRDLILLGVYNLQHRLNVSHYSLEKQRRISHQDYEDQIRILGQYTRFIEYRKIFDDLMYTNIVQGQKIRNEQHIQELNSFMDNPFIKDTSMATSLHSKGLYHKIWGRYYFSTGELEKAAEHQRLFVEIIESDLLRKKEDEGYYIGAMNELMNTLLDMGKLEEAKQILRKLKALPQDTQHLKIKVFQYASVAELRVCEYGGEFEYGMSLIPDIETKLGLYKGRLHKIYDLVIHYQISSLYFMSGKFSKSLMWRNKMLFECDMHSKEDVVCASKIMNLINHFELGNTDILEFALRSTYRYLYQKKRIYKHEKLVLDFIRKLCLLETERDLREAFISLKQRILLLQNDRYEKNSFGFDIVSWIESRIEGRPLQEIVREKALKRSDGDHILILPAEKE